MELTLNRVKLQLMQLEHAEQLYKIIEETPSIWAYMLRQMRSKHDMEEMVKEALENYQEGTVLPFIVVDQVTNSIVGSTRLYNISTDYKTLELGTTFYAPSVQRTSINTECKYLLLRHAFEALQMVRVQIKTDLRNKRAQKAIERLGAVKEGTLRNERTLYTGQTRDACVYSIISQEWSTVKEHLQSLLQKSY
ncbi:GNAT family N-acetyltransferase [Microbacteriaceae bacterium 4G12]